MIAFVRHGQTAMNREGRIQGRVDPRLSELGLAQAAALAGSFTRPRPARVISSPLQRARETAAAIATPHALQVEQDERLIELDYGEWDGASLRDISPDTWAAWRADVDFAPPGGESLADVTGRMRSFIDDTLSDELVVAVSHVSPIKLAVCIALGVDEHASWRMFLDVASVTRVGRRPDGLSYLVAYNDTSHLAAS